MADEPRVDENGKRIWNPWKKVIEPRPHEEDFTRVKVGPGRTDYEYADPTTLFQLERLVPRLAGCKSKSDRYNAGRGFPKYVRELADAAEPFWPEHGYTTRHVDVDGEVPGILEQTAPELAGEADLEFEWAGAVPG